MTEDARVPMLSIDDALAAGQRAGVPDALARLSIFRVLLRRERVAKATGDLLLSLLFGGVLDARLRELVIMRIGWATGSVYEWTQHWKVATDLGIGDGDLLGVRDWRAAGFGAVEQAVLAATDEALERGALAPETVASLKHHLGDDEVLELVTAIGTWTMISTVLRSLDVPLEDGVDPWPPDRRQP